MARKYNLAILIILVLFCWPAAIAYYFTRPKIPDATTGPGMMGSTGASGTMGTSVVCRSCGASIPAGATKCPSCGASVI
ncbi:zinc-ribbon domain-containing protein [Candidatus Bathyarchaeota archaeon]|nr:MAG: zinc-ribbon domain-containing protein [Candidatus Bathyarchaeota archaeon]TMI31271.1 MAG: zinc-ribbon domain-containing protein [Candidatus Bathyarchaeota archaeon]